ncbi:MAG: sensor histidine kinase [Lawsonibacter sp.]|nr:sensor histidine kinase [Lawsonibacter sp.]
MKKSKLPKLRLSIWQRWILIGFLMALSSQFYLSAWAQGFRVSAAAILYPVLLVTMMRDSHHPDTGLATGLFVTVFRTAVDLLQGTTFFLALQLEYPGGIFYLCYDSLLCLLVRDRRSVSRLPLWFSFFLCDALSNMLNLTLSSHLTVPVHSNTLVPLVGLALLRSFIALALLWAADRYRQLLLKEEHEQRYRHLFLMTANLKTELYFLKKDAEDIETVMTHAYQLYEQLERYQVSEDLTALALSIARDVHEVKKDNLRIIRGIDEEVAGTYDRESMFLSDLLHILEVSTRQFLGDQRANIRLECHCQENFSIREHYRLLSILKNLVTNSVEAIQSGSGRGAVYVDCWSQGNQLYLRVRDNGPGILPRAKSLLFQVGYSTKYDPDTGDIKRGVGLSAVQYIVEELGGTIQVESVPDKHTQFQIGLPLGAVTGEGYEDLHH